jgi:hypothetical protein
MAAEHKPRVAYSKSSYYCPIQNISKLSQSLLPSTTEGYFYVFRSSIHITLHPNKEIPEVDSGRSDF